MKIFLKDIKERCESIEILNYDECFYFESFNHDSRVNIPNSLFIPIVGDNFDGHDFIGNALENGCTCTLLQDCYDIVDNEVPTLVVKDIEKGLEEILNVVRSYIDVPIIAITGSTGKTTTREMLSAMLGGRVLTSERNYNTLWGNAYVLSQYDGHDYVVLEFGMDRMGEIASQCRAITPDFGVLLNVGHVHAMHLGGIENVFLAKRELADYCKEFDKPLVLNIDDEWLSKVENLNVVRVGSNNGDIVFDDVEVSESGTDFEIEVGDKEYDVHLNVLGKGYVYNAVCAIGVGGLLGVGIEDCIAGLNQYDGFKGRFEVIKVSDSLTVVNDAYNANPTSMMMSLDTFNEIWGNKEIRKILVLGDMKELGDVSDDKHREVGDFVKGMNVDSVYYLGEYFNEFGCGEFVEGKERVLDILRELKDDSRESVVLLKASNSIGLYDLVNGI